MLPTLSDPRRKKPDLSSLAALFGVSPGVEMGPLAGSGSNGAGGQLPPALQSPGSPVPTPGLPPGAFNADIGAAQSQYASFAPQIKDLIAQIQVTSPYEKLKARLSGARAETAAEKAALELNQPQPFTSPGFNPKNYGINPASASPSLPVPDRPDAKVNPWAAILGGIGGLIVPQGATQFADATVQGALKSRDRNYQDLLHVRQMKLEQLDRLHQDELAARDEALKIAEANYGTQERNRLAGYVASNDYKKALALVDAKLKGIDAEDQALGKLSREDSDNLKLKARLEVLMDTEKLAFQDVKDLRDLDFKEKQLRLTEDLKRLTQEGLNAERDRQERNRQADNARADRALANAERNTRADNARADAQLGVSQAHLGISGAQLGLAKQRMGLSREEFEDRKAHRKGVGVDGEKLPTGGEVERAQSAWIASTKERMKTKVGSPARKTADILEVQRAQEYNNLYKARHGYFPYEEKPVKPVNVKKSLPSVGGMGMERKSGYTLKDGPKGYGYYKD